MHASAQASPAAMNIDSLPSEILIQILSLLSARDTLLRASPVSRRFRALAARVHLSRAVTATDAVTVARPRGGGGGDHVLVLECYHPSDKISTPTLFCEYLGTREFLPSLAGEETATATNDDLEGGRQRRDEGGEGGGEGEMGRGKAKGENRTADALLYAATADENEGNVMDMARLNAMYSRFRLSLGEDGDHHRRPRARHPRRRRPSREHGEQEPGQEQETAEEWRKEEKPPSIDVYLDEGERFSQLCSVVSLIKVRRSIGSSSAGDSQGGGGGARRGAFLGITNIADGVARVFRRWMRDNAAAAAAADEGEEDDLSRPEPVLWVGSGPGRLEDVGLVFRVREKERDVVGASDGGLGPLLVRVSGGDDDEPPVSYTLEFLEIRIRTNQLVLALETSLAHQVPQAGKAMVIAL